MPSTNQTDSVKRLELEGWVVTPAPDKLVLGGPILMKRDGVTIAIIPNGDVQQT